MWMSAKWEGFFLHLLYVNFNVFTMMKEKLNHFAIWFINILHRITQTDVHNFVYRNLSFFFIYQMNKNKILNTWLNTCSRNVPLFWQNISISFLKHWLTIFSEWIDIWHILSVMSILYLLNFLNVFLIYSDYWFTFDSSFFHFAFHLCCHIISNPRFSV